MCLYSKYEIVNHTGRDGQRMEKSFEDFWNRKWRVVMRLVGNIDINNIYNEYRDSRAVTKKSVSASPFFDGNNLGTKL